jgi:hypothetical protein
MQSTEEKSILFHNKLEQNIGIKMYTSGSIYSSLSLEGLIPVPNISDLLNDPHCPASNIGSLQQDIYIECELVCHGIVVYTKNTSFIDIENTKKYVFHV